MSLVFRFDYVSSTTTLPKFIKFLNMIFFIMIFDITSHKHKRFTVISNYLFRTRNLISRLYRQNIQKITFFLYPA